MASSVVCISQSASDFKSVDFELQKMQDECSRFNNLTKQTDSMFYQSRPGQAPEILSLNVSVGYNTRILCY